MSVISTSPCKETLATPSKVSIHLGRRPRRPDPSRPQLTLTLRTPSPFRGSVSQERSRGYATCSEAFFLTAGRTSRIDDKAESGGVARAYLRGGEQRVLVHLCAEAFPGDNEE